MKVSQIYTEDSCFFMCLCTIHRRNDTIRNVEKQNNHQCRNSELYAVVIFIIELSLLEYEVTSAPEEREPQFEC